MRPPSPFPTTVISQEAQAAGLASQPLLCLLPHIPTSSPTDPFIPSLHVHLQGKDPSPRPRFSTSSHVCPYIHHPSAPGLPVLVPRDSTGWPCLPAPSPSGFTAAWTAHSNMASGWLTFTPQEPPSPPTLSAIALSASASTGAPTTLLSVQGRGDHTPVLQPRPLLPKPCPLSSTLASLPLAQAAGPQSPFPLPPQHTARLSLPAPTALRLRDVTGFR